MPKLSEDTHRLIDTSCKVAGTIVGIILAVLGVSSYISTRADALKNASIEARKPVFQKRLDGCIAAVTAANAVATTTKKDKPRADAEFKSIYWGTISVIADRNIGTAATQVYNCVNDPNCSQAQVSLLMISLAKNCRTSIGDDWNVRPPNGVASLTVVSK